MTFLRLEDNRLINISQVVIVIPPKNERGYYQVVMTTGRFITLTDREAQKLMQLITIYSPRVFVPTGEYAKS